MNKGLSNLILSLKNSPYIIQDFLVQIPNDKLDIIRNKDAWSIRQHLYHMAGGQEMLYERILSIKNDTNPKIMPYIPTKEAEEKRKFNSIEDAISKYIEIREKQISIIESLSSEELLKKAEHLEYKRYNIIILLNHILFHDYWHMYRIEEILLLRDEYFI